jgi:hypothetical protein
VNRWRQRLAELRGEGIEGTPRLAALVQNVHNVQNPAGEATFEHFEQIEQRENAHPRGAVKRDGDDCANGRARFGLPEVPEEPLLLRDGRRLWRFRAGEVQDAARGQTAALVDEAHWHGAILVADGCELVVVEPWLSNLPLETLCELRLRASGAIAELLKLARARWQEAGR